jgi:hypothetical protein
MKVDLLQTYSRVCISTLKKGKFTRSTDGPLFICMSFDTLTDPLREAQNCFRDGIPSLLLS